MSSGNVTLHPADSGEAAILRACPERAERVEWETSLIISDYLFGKVKPARIQAFRIQK